MASAFVAPQISLTNVVARRTLVCAGCAVLWLVPCVALAQDPPAEQIQRLQLDPLGSDREAPNLWIPTLHATLLMTGMRVSEALIWPEVFAETEPSIIGERYQRAFTQPPKWDSSQRAFEWDGDAWYINVVGHGLFGSELYLRARQCRLGVLGSLVFTTAASAVWEYGFEANGVRPSGLDVWYTPLSGAVFGELRYAGWRAAAGIQSGGLRQTLRTILDPFGELERAFGARC